MQGKGEQLFPSFSCPGRCEPSLGSCRPPLWPGCPAGWCSACCRPGSWGPSQQSCSPARLSAACAVTVEDFVFVVAELHMGHGPFLQPVWVPLDGSPTLTCTEDITRCPLLTWRECMPLLLPGPLLKMLKRAGPSIGPCSTQLDTSPRQSTTF